MKVLYALSHISYLWNKFLYLQNSLPSIIIISESSVCLYIYCSTFPSFISELPYTLYCSLIFCLILMPTMCRQWNMQASMTHIAPEDGCFVLSLETNFATYMLSPKCILHFKWPNHHLDLIIKLWMLWFVNWSGFELSRHHIGGDVLYALKIMCWR